MGSPLPQKKNSQSRASHQSKRAKTPVSKGAIAGTPLFLQRDPTPNSTPQPTPPTLDPAVQPQAADLKAKITAKLDEIIAHVERIDTSVSTAANHPEQKGYLSFPGRPNADGLPETEPLQSIITKTVANHNTQATLAVQSASPGTTPTPYLLTEAEVLTALQKANSYSAAQWNEWAGSKTGQWDGKWDLSEIWTQAMTQLPFTTYKGIWQDAYWFVDANKRQDLEKVGFNLTLKREGKNDLVMGFDPKSNESSNKTNPDKPTEKLPPEPMDLEDPTKLAKAPHRGYPFTSHSGHLCIVWVSGAEVFVESLFNLNNRRIKVSGSLWGGGHWQYAD